jgi:hypothetical protein
MQKRSRNKKGKEWGKIGKEGGRTGKESEALPNTVEQGTRCGKEMQMD